MASEKIRNVAIIGHGGSGKTSLTEVLLFNCGATNRIGKIEDGSTVSDFDADEIKRKISIIASMAPCKWGGVEINILDTPGYADFIGEVIGALRIVDAAIVVLSAVSGVEVGAERGWSLCDRFDLPRMVLINKMDRESASFYRSLNSAKQAFGDRIVPIQIPLGEEANFKGVIDLITKKVYLYDGNSGKFSQGEVSSDELERVEDLRSQLVEKVVETDDDLLTSYLEGEDISDDSLVKVLNNAVKSGLISPVLCCSSTKNVAIHQLLDKIVEDLPDPLHGKETLAKDAQGNEAKIELTEDSPLAALVFKTMADPYVGRLTFFRVYSGKIKSDSHVFNINKNKDERIGQLFKMKGKQQEMIKEAVAGEIAVVAKLAETTTGDTLSDKGKTLVLAGIEFPRPITFAAVEPKAKGDEEKISTALAKLVESDQTLHVERSAETNQTIISGMGDNHLEIIVDKLKNKFGVEVKLSVPRVAYKETIRSSTKVQYKHKKQTGGRGQYGEVYLELTPLPKGSGFQFEETIFGGAIPKGFIPAVEKGVRDAMEQGVIARYPVVDVKANCYDGSFHQVDSSELAFKIASSMAFKKGVQEANPVLLEPIQMVEVIVPERFMGDIISDLNSKRGKILGMEPIEGGQQIIKALIPIAEMYHYSADLTSITGGRGTYNMQFDHYEEVPAHLTEKIIQARKEELEKS